MRRLAWWILGLVVLTGGATAWALIGGGWYDVSAITQHWQSTYKLIEMTMHHSVQRQARDIAAPATLDAAMTLQRGASCYRDHCIQCHGGPGVARSGFAMSLQPVPGPLIDAAHDWKPRELYWITRHGLKMSGMPAWQFRLDDADLWAVTAFVMHLPEMSPDDFATRIAAGGECRASEPGIAPAPSAERGEIALRQYACHACHTIPGVVGAKPQVGPPLAGIARRQLIAGRLPNTTDNMVRWLREPRRIDAHSAMPDLGVTEADARDMAAYLATLR